MSAAWDTDGFYGALKVGDEIAYNDFNSVWHVAKIVQLGKGKGQRFKIVYGPMPYDQQWLNDRGRATLNTYYFAHIEPLTDEIRAKIEVAMLRRVVVSRATKLSADKALEGVSAPDLTMIASLLKQVLMLLPKSGQDASAKG